MPTDSTISPPARRLDAPEALDDILGGLQDGPRIYISLAEAARLFPPNRPGKAVHVATVTRWVAVGIRAHAAWRQSERIRLRAVRRPGGWMTTREWVAEFLAAITADRTGQSAPTPVRTSAARSRAAERAGHELDKIGI